MKLPIGIRLHCGGFFVAENEESALPQYDLCNSSSWRRNYGARNFKLNGFYVGTVQDAFLRAKIDKIYDGSSRYIEQHRNNDRILQPVFNTMEVADARRKELYKMHPFAKIDRGRNMVLVSKLPKCELEFKTSCTDVANEVRDLILKDLNILKSRKTEHEMVLTLLETESPSHNTATNVMEEIDNQIMHTDVDSKNPKLDDDHMFIGILATQAGSTTIRVCAKSHVTYRGLAQHIHRVTLGRYDYFVAHPKLIHGGCGCMEQNIRLHFYHGLPKAAREQTFYVDWELFQSKNTLIDARKRQAEKGRSRKRLSGKLKKSSSRFEFNSL